MKNLIRFIFALFVICNLPSFVIAQKGRGGSAVGMANAADSLNGITTTIIYVDTIEARSGNTINMIADVVLTAKSGVSLRISSTSSPQFVITHTVGADSVTQSVDGNGLFTITTVDGGGAAGHIALMPDGNVGIGITSPQELLEVHNPSANAIQYISTDLDGAANYAGIFFETDRAGSPSFGEIGLIGDGASRKLIIGIGGNLVSGDDFVITSTGIGMGTQTADRLLHPESATALTNTVAYGFRLSHITSGTPATNIGIGMEFEQETSASNNEVLATIEVIASDAGSGTEDGDIIFKTMTGGSAATEKVRFDGDGNVGIGTSPSTSLHVDSNGANTVAIVTLENTAGDVQLFRIDATPEAAVTGSIGDLAIDGTGGVLYFKQSGSASNTGWLIIGGTPTFKSYSLSNPGNSGTFYVGGHYAFAAADANLTIGGAVTQTFGTAGQAHGSHAFCVASGAGGTDLVLTVTGVSITDAGVKNDSDTEIIVADADAAITDEYFETSKKWLGQITYTLTGAAGTFDFNYGFVKYEDFGNKAFTVTDFEATGEARANETGLNIELLHHESGAFVYDAAAFIPNQTALINLATDYGTNNDVASGDGFAYRRAGMSTAVAGNASEGLLIRITTAVNNSINDATFHIGATLK